MPTPYPAVSPPPAGSTRTPPRPVLLYGMVSAAVVAFLGGASAVELVPPSAIAVVGLTWAVIGGAWAVYVQSVTTPIADPADARGVPLIPVDAAPADEPDLPTTRGEPLRPDAF